MHTFVFLPCESPSIFLDKSFLGESLPTHLGKIEATLLRGIVFFVDPHMLMMTLMFAGR